MNRKSELQAHDGQNSENLTHDKGRPEIVDPERSCGVFFHDHMDLVGQEVSTMKISLLVSANQENNQRIAPIEAIAPDDPIWRRWHRAHGGERIGVDDAAALKGVKNIERLRLALVKTAAAKEALDLGAGVYGRLCRIGFRRFSIKIIPPIKSRVSFSPDKFAFRSEVAL